MPVESYEVLIGKIERINTTLQQGLVTIVERDGVKSLPETIFFPHPISLDEAEGQLVQERGFNWDRYNKGLVFLTRDGIFIDRSEIALKRWARVLNEPRLNWDSLIKVDAFEFLGFDDEAYEEEKQKLERQLRYHAEFYANPRSYSTMETTQIVPSIRQASPDEFKRALEASRSIAAIRVRYIVEAGPEDYLKVL